MVILQLLLEYNARFGSELSVTIPYDENFNRNRNKSNLYYGASLMHCKLGIKKLFINKTNLNGNNAYFIKNDNLPKDHS